MKPSPTSRASAARLWRALPSVSLGLLLLGACRERPADLREWKVTDHDHTESPSSGQVQVDPAASTTPAVPGLEDVTIVAWQQNCTQCHGQLGRGDGPRGPMVKATNLSDPAWQTGVTDEQIARAIKEGKGAMPAFKLPDGTIANLVKLVRMMNAARLGPHGSEGSAPSASASASAGASAAPPAGSATPAAPKSAPSPATKPPAAAAPTSAVAPATPAVAPATPAPAPPAPAATP